MHVTPSDIGQTEQGKANVLAAFAGMSDAELVRRPPDDGWNAWEIAYHLFDIERWHVAKLCEAASVNRVEALQRFMHIWARLRDEAVAVAREIPAERLDTPGLLGGVPDWTPRQLLAAIAVHDHDHAVQTRTARGAAASKGAG